MSSSGRRGILTSAKVTRLVSASGTRSGDGSLGSGSRWFHTQSTGPTNSSAMARIPLWNAVGESINMTHRSGRRACARLEHDHTSTTRRSHGPDGMVSVASAQGKAGVRNCAISLFWSSEIPSVESPSAFA